MHSTKAEAILRMKNTLDLETYKEILEDISYNANFLTCRLADWADDGWVISSSIDRLKVMLETTI